MSKLATYHWKHTEVDEDTIDDLVWIDEQLLTIESDMSKRLVSVNDEINEVLEDFEDKTLLLYKQDNSITMGFIQSNITNVVDSLIASRKVYIDESIMFQPKEYVTHEEHVRVHAEASRGLYPDSLILSSDTYNKMLSTYSQVLKDAAIHGTGMVEATYDEGEVTFTHIPVREYWHRDYTSKVYVGVDYGLNSTTAIQSYSHNGNNICFIDAFDKPETIEPQAAHSEFKIGDEIIGNDFCNTNTLGKIIKIESHSVYKFVYTVVTSDKSRCVFYEDELKLAPTQLAPPIQRPWDYPPMPNFAQQYYGSTAKPEPLTVGCSHKNKRASYVMIAGRKEDFWVCVDCKEEVK